MSRGTAGTSSDDGRLRFLVLFSAVLLPMFLAAVDQTVLALASPAIGREFGDLNGISWLAVGYLLASVVMVPLYGRLADRYGRRRLLGVAIGVFAAGSLACLLAPTLPLLIVARGLQGAGGAGLMSLSQALIGEVLQPRERARYQVYFAVLFASASLVGPLLGGLVVELGNWRWLFAANLPLCALAGWRLSRLNHVPPPLETTGRVDVRGGLMFAATAALSLWLLSRTGGVSVLSGWSAWAVPALAVCAWIALWHLMGRTPRPYLPLELLRLPVMRHSAMATVAYAAAMFSLVFYLPAYVQLAFGSTATEAGVLLLPLTGGMIVGSTLAGRVVLVTGRTREPPLFGLLLAAVGLACLGLLTPSRTLVMVLGGGSGIGLGMVMSVTQIITQVAAGPQKLGAAAAVISLSRNMGAATGAAAFGAIAFGLSGRLPGVAASAEATAAAGGAAVAASATVAASAAGSAGIAGFHAAFLVTAGVCLAGAWAASRLPPERLAHDRKPASS